MKLEHTLHKDIIEAYTVDLWSLREIAEVLHVSRTTVRKLLQQAEVDTSKHRLQVSCTVCGKPIWRTRKRVRKQKNHFCNQDCYSSFLDAGGSGYVANRMAQKIARSVVSQYFSLQPEHAVHHEDRNNLNNVPANLRVFATQGDHIRYHHAKRDEYFNPITQPKSLRRESWERYNRCDVKPIWDGRNAIERAKPVRNDSGID